MTYQFKINKDVAVEDIARFVGCGIHVAEMLFGAPRVRAESSYMFDDKARVVIINGDSTVGSHLVQILSYRLTEEFGEESFEVKQFADEEAAYEY